MFTLRDIPPTAVSMALEHAVHTLAERLIAAGLSLLGQGLQTPPSQHFDTVLCASMAHSGTWSLVSGTDAARDARLGDTAHATLQRTTVLAPVVDALDGLANLCAIHVPLLARQEGVQTPLFALRVHATPSAQPGQPFAAHLSGTVLRGATDHVYTPTALRDVWSWRLRALAHLPQDLPDTLGRFCLGSPTTTCFAPDPTSAGLLFLAGTTDPSDAVRLLTAGGAPYLWELRDGTHLARSMVAALGG